MNKKDNSDRREFLSKFAIFGSMFLAIGLFVNNIFAFLLPGRKEKTYHKYLVARQGEIPLGKAKEITIGKKPVFVVHLESGYKVFSGICTHLGCIVRWEEQKNRFFCPCHQGIFNKSGAVIEGPPPRPLDEYKIKLDKKLVFIMIEDKKEGPWV